MIRSHQPRNTSVHCMQGHDGDEYFFPPNSAAASKKRTLQSFHSPREGFETGMPAGDDCVCVWSFFFPFNQPMSVHDACVRERSDLSAAALLLALMSSLFRSPDNPARISCASPPPSLPRLFISLIAAFLSTLHKLDTLLAPDSPTTSARRRCRRRRRRLLSLPSSLPANLTLSSPWLLSRGQVHVSIM